MPSGDLSKTSETQSAPSPARAKFWVLALLVLRPCGPWQPLPGSLPPGYKLIYNLNGDHHFHLVRSLPRARTYNFAGALGLYFMRQLVTLPAPMQTLAEPSGTVGARFLFFWWPE
jgi:hypothetical protein